MDLTLSSDDFARLQGSMVVLLDPTVDFTAWRTGVNARVRALLETDEDVLYLPRAAMARPGRSGRGASTQSASPHPFRDR